MPENDASNKRSANPDWFVRGTLTRIGDIFDRFTGRGWKPSSSLATSELIERLKRLLDAEAKQSEDGRLYVPHNIKLKMQWDKFSTDSDENLRTLENEFLIAAVDHINDKRYYTYAPLSIEVKPDYFTSGVKLFVSFERFTGEEHEAEINVSVPGIRLTDEVETETPAERVPDRTLTVTFEISGRVFAKVLNFSPGERKTVGRTRENDLPIDDISVSKFHASLAFNSEGSLVVADTGSTNGTFINDSRIAYGKAVGITTQDRLRFGSVGVRLSMPSVVLNSGESPASDEVTEAFSASVLPGKEMKEDEQQEAASDHTEIETEMPNTRSGERSPSSEV